MKVKTTPGHRPRVRRAPDLTLDLGVQFLRALDTPVSNTLADAVVSGNHRAVSDAEIDPASYEDLDLFWRDYCAVNLLRKSVSLTLDCDKSALAFEAFIKAEQSCATVNRKLRRRFANPSIGLTAESYIHTARKNIASLLSDFDWNAAEVHFSFSSGASTRLRRVNGDAFYKYSGKPETTSSCLALAVACVRSKPIWERSLTEQFGPNPLDWFTVVKGSKITTVPKSAKIDRVIAIEPCMNMYVQKGIGALIRKKLKRVGIDLNDQTLNQSLARDAYAGNLATIDLAAASDSVSLELCRALLPPDWFRAMSLCRSAECTFPNGLKHQLEKVSSMGNGFTFELESLIFWALARAVQQLSGETDRRLGVYGDDLIISRNLAPTLIEVLDYCGFSCNSQKTFLSGNFFESCGKHYFKGVDVTPVYVKEPVAGDSRILWFINSIRRWAARPTQGWADGRFYLLYLGLLPYLSYRPGFIPDGVGDMGLIGSFSEARPRLIRGMWVTDVLMDRRTKFRPDGPSACLAYFQGTEVGQSDDYYYVVDRQKEGRFRKATLRLSQWTDAPIWCI